MFEYALAWDICITAQILRHSVFCIVVHVVHIVNFQTQNQKSPSPRNRPSSDEVKKRPGLGELTKTNLHKSVSS